MNDRTSSRCSMTVAMGRCSFSAFHSQIPLDLYNKWGLCNGDAFKNDNDSAMGLRTHRTCGGTRAATSTLCFTTI